MIFSTFPMGLLKSGVNLVKPWDGALRKPGLLAVGHSFGPVRGLESLLLGQRDNLETNRRMESKRVILHQ